MSKPRIDPVLTMIWRVQQEREYDGDGKQAMRARSEVAWWKASSLIGREGPSRTGIQVGHEATDGAVSFWALIGFTFMLVIAPQTVFPALASLRLALVFAVVGVAACILEKVSQRKQILALTREMRPAAMLAAWAIATVPFSYWPGGSVSILLDLYLKALVIFWLLCNTVTNSRRLRRVMIGLTLMAVPLALTGVRQYLSGAFLPGAGIGRIIGYDAPLTGNPNDLALMLDLILPLTVALLLNTRHSGFKLFWGAAAILDIVAIILTFSRGGFMGLATTAGVYCWKLRDRPERRWIMVAVVIAILCVPLLPSGYLDRLGTITSIEEDATGSAQTRWTDMKAAMSVIMQHPIVGVGIGSNVLALNKERGASWHHVHDVYLQYGADLGIPGLVIFLMLLIRCIRAVRPATDPASAPSYTREISLLAEGIHVSLLTFAVSALFHPVAYHFFFYYIGGLAIAAKGVRQALTHGVPLDAGAGVR